MLGVFHARGRQQDAHRTRSAPAFANQLSEVAACDFDRKHRLFRSSCGMYLDCIDGGFVYSTLVLRPEQNEEVSLDEREALKRRLCHLSTDIFGDDPELCGLLSAADEADSHIQHIVPRN
jgi:hypothetical protein